MRKLENLFKNFIKFTLLEGKIIHVSVNDTNIMSTIFVPKSKMYDVYRCYNVKIVKLTKYQS